MSFHTSLSALMVAALLLMGCASPPQNHRDSVARLETRLQQEHSQVASITLTTAEPERNARVEELLRQPLTPTAGLEMLLINSPVLRADLASLGVADARRLQAGLVANPVFGIGALRPEGGGRWQLDFGISQSLLELFTRPLRESLAEAELNEMQLRIYGQLSTRIGVFNQHYFAAIAARQQLALSRANLKAAEASDSLAQSLFAAGNIPERQRLEYKLVLHYQQRQLQQAMAEAQQTRLKLMPLLGLETQTPLKLPAQLPPMPPGDNLEQASLYQSALEKRADLQLALAEVRTSERLLALQQKAGGFSHLELGLDYERESDGSYKVGPEVSFTLPLFDRGQYRAQQADAALARAQALLQQKQLDTQSDIAQQLVAIGSARRSYQDLQQQSLPLNEQVQQLKLREYNFMFASGFDLLQLKKEEFALQQQSLNALLTYWQARTQLALLSGQPLIYRLEDHHGDHHHD